MVTCVRTQNLTLSAIAALCAIAPGSKPPFISNPLIHAIVTFNVDAVLREYVEARYHKALVRSVERASKEPMNGRIDLYYMHGFLRYDRKAGSAGKEGADKLVLQRSVCRHSRKRERPMTRRRRVPYDTSRC
jgi:hypothetical protein